MSIPLDEDGFVRRECPRCIREFKVRLQALDQQDSYFCPYCRAHDGAEAWWTQDQIRYQKEIAAEYMASELAKELKKLARSSKGLPKLTNKGKQPKSHPLPAEENDMRRVDFSCHPDAPVKVLPEWVSLLHCFHCGSPSTFSSSALPVESGETPVSKEIAEKERAREMVLRAAHDLSGGDAHRYFSLDELANHTGLSDEQIHLALQYLSHQDLVVPKALGGMCGLTPRGVQAYERLVKGPPQSAAPIPPIVQNFHAAVGAVQTGNYNTAQVLQQNGPALKDVQALIESLHAAAEILPPEVRQDATEQLDNLKDELHGQSKPSRVKAALLALWLATNSIVDFAPKVIELGEKLGFKLPPG